MTDLSIVLVSLRASRGWSQSDLAKRAGVSRNCIALIESRNARANSTLETLKLIFGAFGLEMEIKLSPRRKQMAK